MWPIVAMIINSVILIILSRFYQVYKGKMNYGLDFKMLFAIDSPESYFVPYEINSWSMIFSTVILCCLANFCVETLFIRKNSYKIKISVAALFLLNLLICYYILNLITGHGGFFLAFLMFGFLFIKVLALADKGGGS